MSRPQKQKQTTSSSSWYQKLTATVLLGSFLQTTIPIPVIAQQTNNLGASSPLINQATYTYTDSATNQKYDGTSSQLNASPNPLVDPLGRILGCAGTILPDYTGFSVGVYEPNPKRSNGNRIRPLGFFDSNRVTRYS